MDGASTSSTLGMHGRQKRVLPSRSRRGGPGVGNCDADTMILETQRRKFENEPLVPANTPFLLTTNPAVASTSSSTYDINIHANDRYFERPEVLKAYREQLIIQTPEFISLGDTPAGRLRARSQAGITDTGPAETSDAAYEKRHRKYETFEKRQRLREKEKLKHEQYKLKERIDQLRAMDPSAFLTLPDNLFPAPAGEPQYVSENGEEGISAPQFNGGPNYTEGERRKKEMLNVAHTLEERYRILLPPDRIRKVPSQASMEVSVEPEVSVYVERNRHVTEPQEAPVIETVRQETEKLKLKIKFSGRASNPTVQTSISKGASSKKRKQSVPPPPKQQPVRQIKAIEELHVQAESPIEVVDNLPTPSLHEIPSVTPCTPVPDEEVPPSLPMTSPEPESVSRPTTPMSNPDIAILEPTSPEAEVVRGEVIRELTPIPTQTPLVALESIPAARPHKRAKRSSISSSPPHFRPTREPSVPPIESISAPARHRSPSQASTMQSSKASRKPGLLMQEAIRNNDSTRKVNKRHVTAFGDKLHNEMFDEREFELPDWMDPPRGTGGPDFPDYYKTIPGARTILTADEFSKKPSHPLTLTEVAPS